MCVSYVSLMMVIVKAEPLVSVVCQHCMYC
jgi:hypothetical protein